MKISLQHFESVIDRGVLSRGREYFDNGSVCRLKKIKSGEWVASVHGTEAYNVRVSLKDSDVYAHSCSCPYDRGPVCKHVVAVLFAIRKYQNGSSDFKEERNRKFKKSKPVKSSDDSFEEVISRLPRKGLNTILVDYAGREPDFIEHVFAHRILQAPASEKEEYRQVIRNAVSNVRDRHGFIGYWQASRAVEGADMVLEKAQEFLTKKQPDRALTIFQCVLEEMIPLLQEADDSNGEIGSIIEESLEGLSECAHQAKDAVFHKELFDYLLKECDHSRYEEWDTWRWDILAIAGNVAQTPEESNRLFGKIDEIENRYCQNNDLSRYDSERAAIIKLAVIERLGTKKEAEEFLSGHLDCMPLRERAIERALKYKDYELAKKLALDGFTQDKARCLPGLVNKWTQNLLNIAEARRDKEEIKKYALKLFLDTGSFEYYDRYKKCFVVHEWSGEAQRIIDIIKQSKDGRVRASLPEVYIREKRWPELLNFVRASNSSWALESFARYLIARFPDDLVKIYEKVIIDQLAPPMGRGNYQYLCRFLRQLQKLDAKDRVKRLVAELSAKYSNRPAMIEELRRV